MRVGPSQGQNEGPSLTVDRVLQPLLLRTGWRCRMIGECKVKDTYTERESLKCLRGGVLYKLATAH